MGPRFVAHVLALALAGAGLSAGLAAPAGAQPAGPGRPLQLAYAPPGLAAEPGHLGIALGSGRPELDRRDEAAEALRRRLGSEAVLGVLDHASTVSSETLAATCPRCSLEVVARVQVENEDRSVAHAVAVGRPGEALEVEPGIEPLSFPQAPTMTLRLVVAPRFGRMLLSAELLAETVVGEVAAAVGYRAGVGLLLGGRGERLGSVRLDSHLHGTLAGEPPALTVGITLRVAGAWRVELSTSSGLASAVPGIAAVGVVHDG